MGNQLSIQLYSEQFEKKWDKFVLEESVNGTFLQTRKFLNYHPRDRFIDHSLMFMKGNTIMAVIPACLNGGEKNKKLVSHSGSTFGGIILGSQFKKITDIENLFGEMDLYFSENNFMEIILKMTSRIYAKNPTEILDYFLFINGFTTSYEVGYYINFENYADETEKNFNVSKRQHYKYSLKNSFSFFELTDEGQITDFYQVLCDNYLKFDKKPVHTLKELLDLKYNRLKNRIRFYGISHENELIAGSMVFTFEKKVFHTQYLACRQDKKSLHVNEFLYKNLIDTARVDGFQMISFGTATLESGKVLNKSLAQFKEGFGTCEYVNRTYRKIYE